MQYWKRVMDDDSESAYPSIGPFAPTNVWETRESFYSTGGDSYGANETFYMNCQQPQALGHLTEGYGAFQFGIDPRLATTEQDCYIGWQTPVVQSSYPKQGKATPEPIHDAPLCQPFRPFSPQSPQVQCPTRSEAGGRPANDSIRLRPIHDGHMSKEDCSLATQTPYSYLIYQALLTSPGKKMPLQQIYAWFEKNTTKCQRRNRKGWQMSIRYNLSMNAGFASIRSKALGKKTAIFWRLTQEALQNGIQPTSQFRKKKARERELAIKAAL